MQNFGQPQTSTFGSQATGLFGQKPATSGFGGFQTPAPAFQQTTSAFGQPQVQTGGLFGQPAPQSSAFGGAFGQQPQSSFPTQGGIFGAAPSQIGQQQTGGFFGASAGIQPQSSGWGQPAQPQATGLFGQTSQFGQPQQSQPISTGGLFGTPQQSIGAFGQQPQKIGGFGTQQPLGFGQPNTQPLGAFGQPAPAMGMGMGMQTTCIYAEPQYYTQSVSTVNRRYQIKQIITQEQPPQNLSFTNIRAEDEFSRVSTQMMRLYDTKQAKGQPQVNYEFLAMNEFKNNQNSYSLLQKLSVLTNQAKPGQPQLGGQAFAQPQQSSFGGGFGQTSAWGQPQQQSTGGLFKQTGQVGQANFSSQKPTGLFGQQPQSQFGAQQMTPFGGIGAQQPTSGGLFGQNSPQPQGGLFGQQPAQPAGGLFGQPAQQPQGGLFGQSQAQPAQGLFGQPQQQQQPTQGLFGQQAQPTQGLFGQQSQPQQPAGGLFGQQAQQPTQPAGGLFGQQPQGGLFGANKPTTAPTSGGLFGNTAPPAGSLFGQPAQQPQTSLFGAQPTQPAGGLFSQQAQPQGGLFGSQPAQGSLFNPQTTSQTGLFGTPQPQQTGLFNNTTSQPQQATPKGQPQQQQFYDLFNSQDPLDLKNSFLSKEHPLENIQKDISALKSKIDEKYPAPAADTPSVIYGQPTSINFTIQCYNPPQLSAYQEEAERQRAKYDAKTKQLESQQRSYQKIVPISLYKSSQQPVAPKLDLSSRRSETTSRPSRDTIKLTCSYVHNKDEVFAHVFEIHKSRDTDDVLNKVLQWLRGEFSYDGPSNEVDIFTKNSKLQLGKTLKDAAIQEDTTLRVVLPKINPEPDCQLIIETEDLYPKAPKQGYKCNPPFESLKQMNKQELQKVAGFKIFNEFGSIEWIGVTDLTGLDLADLVTIEQESAEVYDDVRHKATKPAVGLKLNKPAIITLQNIKPRPGQSASEKEQNLRRMHESSGDSQHLYYDGQKQEWAFKVEHFTKWTSDTYEATKLEASRPAEAPQPVLAPFVTVVNELQREASVQMEIDSDSQPSSSFRFKPQDIPQKRFHTTIVEQPTQPVFVPSLPKIIVAAPEVQTKAQQILGRIAAREKIISLSTSVPAEKPSDIETIEYLKQLKAKALVKTSLGRRGVPKPCFHPQGHNILVAQGSKVLAHPLPQVKPFSIKEALQKQLQTFALQQQLSNLSIQNIQDSEMQECNSAKPEFEDQFFSKLLVQEHAATAFLSSQISVYQFLQDLARHYAATAQTKQLQQEFQVVCMLNALFGDPCQQLQMLDKSRSGPQTQFQPLKESLDEQSLSVQKQRRNAVVEVLRFVLRQEYQSKSPITEEQVSKEALLLLEIGDIRAAVSLLNRNKKTQLALLVAQSVNNQFAMRFCPRQGKEEAILRFISGEAQPNQCWMKDLLYELMFKECHFKPLPKILEEHAKAKSSVQSLLWKLLLCYSRVFQSNTGVVEMKGQLITDHEPRDYRLRWVTQVVLSKVFRHQALTEQKEWTCVIPDEILAATAAQYAFQLSSQNSAEEAIQVVSTIPSQQIRRRLLLEVILKTPEVELHLSPQLKHAAQAIKLQSEGQMSQAVDSWVKCKHYTCAEELFSRMVLPSFIKLAPDFNVEKSIHGIAALPPAKREECLINKIKELYPLDLWLTTPSGLYLRVKKLQESLPTFARQSEQACANELQLINQAIPGEDTAVSQWLRTQVTEMMIALRTNTSLNGYETLPAKVTRAQAKRGYSLLLKKGLQQTQ